MLGGLSPSRPGSQPFGPRADPAASRRPRARRPCWRSGPASAGYLTVSAPALATCPSWSPVPPLAPIAPTILPPATSGSPPSERHRAAQGQDRGAPFAERILERFGRAAEQCRRPRLVDRHRHRTVLGVIHALEIDQLAAGIDDRDHVGDGRDIFRLRLGRCRGLFGVVEAERHAIGRDRLRPSPGAARQRREHKQQHYRTRHRHLPNYDTGLTPPIRLKGGVY